MSQTSPVTEWPPLKMALWRVLMDEQLNDGHYIKAFHLIEKLYAAIVSSGHAQTPAEPLMEALGEIANRAGNFMDPDAADWMPSIYKIACEAIGSDPWPMLEANGWKRDTLTVQLSSTTCEGK